MAPETKEARFIFSLTSDERRMLAELADADGRTSAGWLCHAIRTAHAKLKPRPKSKKPKR